MVYHIAYRRTGASTSYYTATAEDLIDAADRAADILRSDHVEAVTITKVEDEQ